MGEALKMELYVLGAGAPIPTAERYGNSCVLRIGDDHLLFENEGRI